jgi:hypothetical protein
VANLQNCESKTKDKFCKITTKRITKMEKIKLKDGMSRKVAVKMGLEIK